MKKVSVQFNLVVGDGTTPETIKSMLNRAILDEFWSDKPPIGKITSIQINNTEKRGKR